MNDSTTGPRRTQGRPAPAASRTAPPRLPESGHRPIIVTAGPAQPAAQARAAASATQQVLRVCRGSLYVIVPMLMLALMAAGILYVRLRHGPIALDIVVPPIERGINAELSSNSVKIQGAELRLGDSGGLEFRLRQLSVLESDGDPVATAPLAAVGISSSALWRGRIVPSRIELIDPEFNLVYTDDDGLALDSIKVPASDVPEKADAAATGAPAAPRAEATIEKTKPQPHQLNLVKMLSDASHRARRRMDASGYLTEFGLRNASVVLEYLGQKSVWKVPEASVDFNHAKRRSIISGRATVSSARGPWALSFLTDENEKTSKLQVKATIRDLVPATLASSAPPLALLRGFDFRVAGDATLELSTAGDVESSEIAIEAGVGRITHPDLAQPFDLTAGLFKLAYDGQERRWQINPSPVKWADGNMLFSGGVRDLAAPGQPPTWRFEIAGNNGVLEAPEFSVPSVNLDSWTVEGVIIPRRGVIDVSKFRMAGGGGEAVAKVITKAGPAGQSTHADVTLSPMPLATLKALWPRALAPGARSWVGERVTAADFKGGTVRFDTGEYVGADAPAAAPGAPLERLSANFEVADSSFIPLDGMSPIEAPRALVQITNNALEVTVPDAAVILPGNRRVPIKAGRLAAATVMGSRPESEITFLTQSQLAPFLETIEQLPVRAVKEAAPFPAAGDGKVDAQMKIKLPLISHLDVDDVVIEGKAKITDGRFGKVGGHFDVQGFTLGLDLTSTTLDAKGDLLINGVPAKIIGQRIFGADPNQQPPIKITADLDESDRNQLGIDVNDIVHGSIAVELSLQKGDRPEPVVKLKADLTNAELTIDQVAWRKAPGRPALLDADIVAGKTHKTELQNFKVSGDDIAIEGWLGIAADNRMREFYFPTFALNIVSRLEVQGTLGNDNIWNIKARGQTFDGRDLFRSLFSVGDGQDKKSKPGKASSGTDLTVDIGNVLGASDASLRGFKMKLSSRADKLSAFDAKGMMEGGAPVAVVMDQAGGNRRLLVDSTDAGQVMRLLDFYPNMQNGRLRLEVNLDGKGPAEKTGILWVDDFRVLGDPIISEVVSSADQGRPAINSNKRVVRETFQFDRMRAPFSVGYGQFVLEESYLKGPLLGANLRGKVDFKTRRVNIGGTYIPLQGLNGALGGIPLLGQLISGTHGEGIFGITFAVQGPLSEPQVLVNPLSIVAPGIFRDMFQMTSENPKVQIREDKTPAKPVQERVRASSTAAPDVKKPVKKPAAQPEIVDGWSSSTNP